MRIKGLAKGFEQGLVLGGRSSHVDPETRQIEIREGIMKPLEVCCVNLTQKRDLPVNYCSNIATLK